MAVCRVLLSIKFNREVTPRKNCLKNFDVEAHTAISSDVFDVEARTAVRSDVFDDWGGDVEE